MILYVDELINTRYSVSMNKSNIEKYARDLHAQIWKDRALLWPDNEPEPLKMLTPDVAAHVLGVEYALVETLGRSWSRDSRFEIAGLIDRQANKIVVSKRFPLDTVAFTGAHEIGHWVLHESEVLHRDRPLTRMPSNPYQRPRIEREADHFAACYLMPKRLVVRAFEARFRTKVPMLIDENAAFWLNASDPDEILTGPDSLFRAALCVAGASTYQGAAIYSMASTFGVSLTAMALRLMELELVTH